MHVLWWARTGSNRRPLVCKTRALPLSYAPMTAAGYTPCGQAPKTLGRKRRQSVGPQPLIANFTRLLHLGEPNDP